MIPIRNPTHTNPAYMSLEIFQYGFVARAIIAGILLAIVLPIVGMFLVVRRYSLFADTLSHVALAGASIFSLFGLPVVLGAATSSLVAGLGLEELRRSSRMGGEALLALFLSGSLAVAVTVSTFSTSGRGAFIGLLFGSVSTVTWNDVGLIAIGTAVILSITSLLWRRLFFLSLDEELASASGLPTRHLSLLLTGMTALLMALSLPIVGALLLGALMVLPVLSALQLRLGFRSTALFAVCFSLLAVLAGLSLSASFNLPSGATVVLAGVVVFGIVFASASTLRTLRRS